MFKTDKWYVSSRLQRIGIWSIACVLTGVGTTASLLDENKVLDIDVTVSLETTWHDMEKTVSLGLVRSIGLRWMSLNQMIIGSFMSMFFFVLMRKFFFNWSRVLTEKWWYYMQQLRALSDQRLLILRQNQASSEPIWNSPLFPAWISRQIL